MILWLQQQQQQKTKINKSKRRKMNVIYFKYFTTCIYTIKREMLTKCYHLIIPLANSLIKRC